MRRGRGICNLFPFLYPIFSYLIFHSLSICPESMSKTLTLNAKEIDYIDMKSSFNIKWPFFRKRLFIALLLVGFTLIGCIPFFRSEKGMNNIEIWDLLSLIPVIIAIVFLIRFLRSMKFTRIDTNHSIDKNFELIKLFLRQKNIGFREANGVIQIRGKKQDNNRGAQEIVFLIPRHHAVLANHIIAHSMIIHVGWSFPHRSRFKLLINELSEWIKEKDTSGIIMLPKKLDR